MTAFRNSMLVFAFVCVACIPCLTGSSSFRLVGEELPLPAPKLASAEESGLDTIELRREVKYLKERRRKYLRTLGEGHPTILDLNDRIGEIEASLGDAPDPADLLTGLTDNEIENLDSEELRKMTGVLIRRVLALENQVDGLRRSVRNLKARPTPFFQGTYSQLP
ncbi:hypothetical protein SAMN06265222_104193 [Neorhodopirellula lusitana]|uniref:Secreted protein n=1 Tax=Neorhodopirellula lusitana TaxID=445327 RepID=A0ABY1Q0N9_9BACT|nr:hypothetical protein [Neorhodopirellula lusitana]SMP54022.1 hypothetical protein SAMN06265222_104193 [Neorhodopirellula lusitana]